MGSASANTRHGAQASGRGARTSLRASLLIASGALLLITAGVGLYPYVSTRLRTASLISSSLGCPHPRPLTLDLEEPQPAPEADRHDLAGAPAQPRDGNPAYTRPGDAPRSNLLDVPLVPTPTAPPTRLIIPAISVDAQVVPVSQQSVRADGVSLAVSQMPARHAVGWHAGSAALGLAGNTVLSGHNAGQGEVFRNLYQLEGGDQIIAYSGEVAYVYTVSQIIVLREEDQSVEVRRHNARYVERTADERLTLVTCHPYASLRYRLIVIARPGITPTGLTTRRGPSKD